jgi:hypothetical protein
MADTRTTGEWCMLYWNTDGEYTWSTRQELNCCWMLIPTTKHWHLLSSSKITNVNHVTCKLWNIHGG